MYAVNRIGMRIDTCPSRYLWICISIICQVYKPHADTLEFDRRVCGVGESGDVTER